MHPKELRIENMLGVEKSSKELSSGFFKACFVDERALYR